jgi:hypothetical protein
MAVDRERFEQGMSYEAYKAQMTRSREQLEENERTVQFDQEDLSFFKELPQRLNVLVLTEDWCGDAIANVPVLGRLAEESGKLNLSVFLRDQNLDLMDQYLNRGEFRSIPTFVFFDEDFKELGHWIERPASITEKRGKLMDELFASDPVFEGQTPGTSPAMLPDDARLRLGQFYKDFRAQTREQTDREVVREIRELLEQSLATEE